MRLSFRSFTTAYTISPEQVSYSDYVVVRLLYEGARDAGFWNLHWTITNRGAQLRSNLAAVAGSQRSFVSDADGVGGVR